MACSPGTRSSRRANATSTGPVRSAGNAVTAPMVGVVRWASTPVSVDRGTLRVVDVDWDRHADPPPHGTPADPHLFWPWAVRAGRAAAARIPPTAFHAPCVLCGALINLGAATRGVSN